MPEQFHIGRETETLATRQKITSKQPQTLQEKIDDFLIELGSVKIKDKVIFFRLLATMLNAGMSLIKALKVLAEQTENRKFAKILLSITKKIENGQSLSESMQEYPDVFDGAQIGMVHSGEASGKLNRILIQLADQFERTAGIRSKIRNAMIYPSVIFSAVIIAGLIMMYAVVPQITAIFKDANVELPLMTRIVVGISDFLQAKTLGMPNIVNVFGGMFVLAVLFMKWKRTVSGKKIMDTLILKMPVFGLITKKAILAQFCQGVSSLSSSGISIIKTLRIVSEIVDNEVYRVRILMIADDVKRGISIGENLKGDTKLFPPMVTSMIAVGEQTAQLDTVTEKVAEFYQSEVDDLVKNLSSLLEPFIIVFLGIGVGFLVGALMKPIMMMSEVASQAG